VCYPRTPERENWSCLWALNYLISGFKATLGARPRVVSAIFVKPTFFNFGESRFFELWNLWNLWNCLVLGGGAENLEF